MLFSALKIEHLKSNLSAKAPKSLESLSTVSVIRFRQLNFCY